MQLADSDPEPRRQRHVMDSWLARGLVRSMPPMIPAVFVVRQHTLFALVANDANRSTEFFRNMFPIASLSQEGVNGLNLGPALLSSYLGEICSHLVTRRHAKLYLNSVDTYL